MAFGGVATGNIKAIEAESVAGIMSKRGFKFTETERAANIGRKICVVAVFEVSSVRNVISKLMEITRSMG